MAMYVAAVFLPLIGALVTGLLGRFLGDRAAQLFSISVVGIAAVLSAFIFHHIALQGNQEIVPLLTFIKVGALETHWALRIDTLTAVMMLVVTWVSFMVHIYSVGYMAHDPDKQRFFAYLNLFTFAMLMLVTSDNLVQLFFGWEGVGLASYLLIGFWYHKPSANNAAMKAFLVNRVGDLGFALGIAGVFLTFDSVVFGDIFAAAPEYADMHVELWGTEMHVPTILALLLFMGAMGKSAQIGLHTWLPDAMEGPTPVSALIHAATMVTAGVFMVARLSPIFELSDTAMTVVAFVGATTAFFAATIGCVQNDIKRIIAYSTCSQLGYMFFALGVGAFSAGIFHLTTHAFFKSLLFLCAGSVIHAMSEEQNIWKMGGLWRHVKITYVTMWVGCLALSGIPFFAGYYSKDFMIEAAFAADSPVGVYAYWMGVLAAAMTAFYSFRLIFVTFHGTCRADEHTKAHIHESPLVMTGPLMLLAVAATFSGMVGYYYFVGGGAETFWNHSVAILPVLEAAHHVPVWAEKITLVLALAGVFAAFFFYILRPAVPGRIKAAVPGPYGFLLNKWYFDELYDFLFVKPAMRLGQGLWKGFDGAVIDGVGPDGVAAGVRDWARRVAALQSGYLFHYAFAMLIGVVGVATWYVLGTLG